MQNPSGQNPPGQNPPDKRTFLLVFSGLMIAMLLSALDQTVFSIALPTIVGDLDGVELMLWVITIYILASTITMPVYGKLGDLVGRKGLFIGAIGIFLAGSVMGALAGDMGWLIAGRAVQGIGGGGLMILSQAIIADITSPRERGKYMGIMGSAFGVAGIVGPLLGGWFTDAHGVGWRWLFWMNVPLGILAILVCAVYLHLPRHRVRPRLDVGGLMLLAVGATCLVLFTTWGGTQFAWDSPVILGLIAATVACAALFVLVERRAAEPIMPLALFRHPNFNLMTIAGLVTGVAMFGVLAYLPTYLQMVNGLGATAAGFLMIPMLVGLLAFSMITGWLVSRTGRYKWMPIAGTALVAVALVLMSTLTASSPLWVNSIYLFLLGTGLGAGMQIMTLVVQNSFRHAMVGTATAANNFFKQIGASLGSALVGGLFTARLTALLAERVPGSVPGGTSGLDPSAVAALPAALRHPIVTSYNDALVPVFLWMAPVVLLAAVLLCFVREDPLRTTIGDAEVLEHAGESLAQASPASATQEESTVEPRTAPR